MGCNKLDFYMIDNTASSAESGKQDHVPCAVIGHTSGCLWQPFRACKASNHHFRLGHNKVRRNVRTGRVMGYRVVDVGYFKLTSYD